MASKGIVAWYLYEACSNKTNLGIVLDKEVGDIKNSPHGSSRRYGPHHKELPGLMLEPLWPWHLHLTII